LFQALEQRRDPRIQNLHPAYASLLIDFYPLSATPDELESLILSLCSKLEGRQGVTAAAIEIPVCYEAEFAPDLENVAQHLRLSTEEVVTLHAAGEYRVYFLGFSPGFAYLGGLSQALQVPRLETPRTHVRAGSLGLAGEQTGIYPNDSPGGWQLIGRTPQRMFDPSQDSPSRLRPGDRVRFKRISRVEFEQLVRDQEHDE
ncbi:MAG TPA: 5-oxoprolinase subunit PxpB, partial [Terriglobales bacterium]|nr:5-oxoprolinase subunit PxpB [Terriglobales bacterium]